MQSFKELTPNIKTIYFKTIL